jgi:hypothetical protein
MEMHVSNGAKRLGSLLGLYNAFFKNSVLSK